ncbi:MAG TPA: acyl-CoA dehydrogenase family protein [Bacteroidales bacterium]|nr:acyl-CoA dehydrogenase family protein [Bacteroidales bacterium]HOX77780.1 acyl-CoA dehydrogenase family protein [Bacteroidales bacterium]HPI86025.1 acyl-CoA dehydrogenase family protein [Bacteroidales bacterium]
MISFQLDTKQQEIIEKYRDFTKRWIIPNRMKYDELATFPWDIVKAAYDEKIINASMPVEYGGHGHSIFEGAIASEELGYGCTGIGICIDASTLALTPLLLMGSDEQKKRIFGEINEKKGVAAYALTEPVAGSDVQGIKSTAIKKGDKYILNGHKRFITNGEVAEYITVFALADPERGSRSLSAFAVPGNSPGVTMVSRLEKMGQRASVQNEIKFENVEVPASNLIGGEGYGFLIAMKTFDRTRTGVASAAVGNAQSAFDYSREWAKKRIQFGHPVTNLQGVSFMLADMATEIEAARMLVWRAAWAYDTQQKDFSKLSAMSKYFATDVAMKVTTDAVQVMGGEGYSKEHPVEKMMRDAKLSQIYEGTNQVNRLVVSKHILK